MALDEGLANTEDALTVFHGERTGRWFYVTAKGPTGHGSRFIPGEFFLFLFISSFLFLSFIHYFRLSDTAVSKLIKFCNKAMEFRKEQEELLGYQVFIFILKWQ